MRDWLKRCVGEIPRLPHWRAIDPLFYACACMVAASLVFGGATKSGFLADVILALLAIPLLAYGAWRLLDLDISRSMRWALWFCVALVALPLLQLVPIPGWLWTLFPHRQISAESFALIGQDLPWMPISVTPEATWLSALSLLPPLSLFVGILLLGYRDRRWLSLVIIIVGLIGVILGLLQVAQGPTSPLRFYRYTNLTEAVGFFANRNHFAALVNVLLLLTAAWAVQAGSAASAAFKQRKFDTPATIAISVCFVLFVILLIAQAMARSRAGIGLTMVALLAAFSLGIVDHRVASGGSTTRRLLFGAIALAVLFTVQLTLYRVLERFEVDPFEDERFSFLSHTIEAARAYMPLGSGVGSFVPVYQLFEPPQGIRPNSYHNRAVNDFAEAWLESGVFALALMGWFAVWFGRRSLEIWRSGVHPQAESIDWSLARAATIIVPVLAIHAFFDYPLRTTAMMAVAAFACALLIEPPVSALRPRVAREHARERHKSGVKLSPVPVLAASAPAITPKALTSVPFPPTAPPTPRRERWGEDTQWPDEWRTTQDQAPPAEASGSDKPR